MARQNVYDDSVFFSRYQEMRRAGSGINEAIEQPAVRSMIGEVGGLDVIDLGCGDGDLCRELVEAGARSVVGIDPSSRMLRLAVERTRDVRIRYVQAFAEDVDLREGCADLVVSCLALHYVADLALVLGRVAGWLRRGGRLVASVEHPIRTASPHLGRHPVAVDGYADEGRRDTTWYVEGVEKYHRRLSTLVNGLISAGLQLDRMDEPIPSPEAVSARPDLADHVRSPALLVLTASQPALG